MMKNKGDISVIFYDDGRQNETCAINGLPFRVIKKDGDIMSLVSGEITVLPFSGNADTVLFLGMCCAGNSMSEWWGQNEAEYD